MIQNRYLKEIGQNAYGIHAYLYTPFTREQKEFNLFELDIFIYLFVNIMIFICKYNEGNWIERFFLQIRLKDTKPDYDYGMWLMSTEH